MTQAEDKRAKSAIEKLVLAAATRPLSLGVLGSGLATALGLGIYGGGGAATWAIGVLAIGTAAYGALVGLDLTNRRFVQAVVSEQAAAAAGEPPRLLEPEAVVSEEHREIYRGIVANLLRAKHIHARAEPFIRDNLDASLAHCHRLVAEAGRAAQKGNVLTQYLRSERPEHIEREIAELEQSAARAGHERAREDYVRAAQTKREQLDTYRQIEALHDRVRAQLTLIDTTLDGVTARLIKLGASDIGEAVTTNEAISTHLESLTSDIHVLESTVDETIQELSL